MTAPSQPLARGPAPSLVLVEPAATAQAPSLTPPGIEDPVVVGLLLPLSGADAGLGRVLRDAAFLALFEMGNPHLVLLPRDTKGTEAGAQAAAREVVAEGAELILGPLFRDAVQGAAPIARAGQVNIIAFSTDQSVAGNGVYLLGFTPEQQVQRILDYAVGRGLQRFAALAPESPYGLNVVQAMQTALQQLGGELTNVEYYAPDGTDAAQAVQRLGFYQERRRQLTVRRRELANRRDPEARRELRWLRGADTYGDLPYDALLLPEGGQLLRQVAPLLPYYDIDNDRVRFLGTGLWDDPGIVKEPALLGGWFAAPTPAAARAFQSRFEAAYGRRPPRIASLAYDAAALAAVLAAGEAGPRFDARSLTVEKGFAGNDGIFRFRDDGSSERGLAVIEVEADGFRVLLEAPNSFEELESQSRPGS